MTLATHPIGVFDSGIGGLSVLQALQAALPHEHFVYLADNAHAPYGEKSDLQVRERTHAIAEHLIAKHQIKALVVACNTATAAAIHELRARHPHLPLVGVEPALKPAVALSQTRRIGVMATRGTVGSDKFVRLLASQQDQAEFVVQACNGLALAIEQSTLPQHGEAAQQRIHELLATYTSGMGAFGTAAGQMDTLVLGCTHYVLHKMHCKHCWARRFSWSQQVSPSPARHAGCSRRPGCCAWGPRRCQRLDACSCSPQAICMGCRLQRCVGWVCRQQLPQRIWRLRASFRPELAPRAAHAPCPQGAARSNPTKTTRPWKRWPDAGCHRSAR